MENIVVAIVIVAIVAGAIAKIVIEKRKGAHCVGCPYSNADSDCSCNF